MQDIIDGKEGAEERFLQERFAREFERYLQDGGAPTKELRGVFRRFKKTLMDIYRSIKIVNGRKAFFNNLEPIKISPEMKHIFDAMLATEDEINAWSAEQKVMEMDKVGLDFTKTETVWYKPELSSRKLTRSRSSGIFILNKLLPLVGSMENWTPADSRRAVAFLLPIPKLYTACIL